MSAILYKSQKDTSAETKSPLRRQSTEKMAENEQKSSKKHLIKCPGIALEIRHAD
jgi:hypothetical protein